MATVLAHVCKISPAARRFDLRFEADGTANATHTQWFARHSWDWDGPHARFIQAHPIRGAPWRIAKRYVCAAKSIRALLIMFRTRPADSPNATCVRPTRFLPWRQVATLFFRTHQRPRDVTHVMVFAYSARFLKTLHM